MIWRCWVIWSSVGRRMAYLVILFPSLMVAFSFITGTFLFITYAHPTSRLALLGAHNFAWATTYYTLRFGTGIIVTILILIRLIAHKRHTQAILSGNAHGKEYTSIITMIIESSAVYSVIGTACLITYGIGSPLSLLFANAATAAQQTNECLIIVRLAQGQAWEEDTVTSIHFRARGADVSRSDSQIDLDSERMVDVKPDEGVSGQIVYL
ncbi:hypothetical protein BD779DRAFT_77070 [Infundibulicybe gibba]|nr:hypothetical protein BD779DRAFT_77070 [Infundibulicybe gibba]